MDEPRRPAAAPTEKAGVEGGDRDMSTDQQPPSTGAPPDDDRDGGMAGEGVPQGGRGPDRQGGMIGEG